MPSEAYDRLLNGLRRYEPAPPDEYERARRELAEVATHFTEPEDVVYRPEPVAGVPAEWIEPSGARPNATLIYLHGGGFYMGSIATYRHFVARIAKATELQTVHIDYRLAPEHPFPAGLEDAVAVARRILADAPPNHAVYLAGDSAGGGLALSTLLRLRESGARLPCATVVFSPWVDLTLRGESYITKQEADPILYTDRTPNLVAWYTRETAPDHPHVSPVYADLAGLPPLLIQVGTEEILLDDSRELARRAEAAGVDVSLDVWDGMVHVWQYYAEWIPEAQEALSRMNAFFRTHGPN